MDSKDRERMITVQRYKEFYVGARCEIVSVHHPVFAKNIGTIVKIVTIYDSGCVEFPFTGYSHLHYGNMETQSVIDRMNALAFLIV